MGKRPEISVIVPVYKAEQYLPQCIDSILRQSFIDFELLLIDDEAQISVVKFVMIMHVKMNEYMCSINIMLVWGGT